MVETAPLTDACGTWHLGGRVFGAKAWLADHVTFFNCKVPGLPTGNVESWDFIAKRIEGTCMNIRIIYGEKGCKAQKLAIPALSSDSGYNFTTAKVHLPLFSSQYPIIRILLGQ